MNPENTNSKRKIFVVSVLILVIAALVALILFLNSRFLFASGKLVSRDSDSLEVTGKKVSVSELLKLSSPEYLNLEECEITAEEYESLKEHFPECEIRWSIPLSSWPVSNKSTEITLTSISESDVPLFAYFDDLKTVHADGISDWETLSVLEKQYPDLDISWGITLNGKLYSADITELVLNEPVEYSELAVKLKAFSVLQKVSMANDGLSSEEKLSLAESLPDTSFSFTVEEFGTQFLNTTEKLDFSDRNDISIDRLIQIAPLFKAVKSIDFAGCNYSNDEMYKVMQAFPDANVDWQIEIYGKKVSSVAEEIDLSGIEITDTAEIENALPYFRNLSKVIMSDCGIENEEMDALDKRHDDVRFVWTVYLGEPRRGYPRYELRTDTTYFISSLQLGEEHAYRLFDDTAEPLKYCTDMVALDLGHNKITKCEFCRYMPKLRYFIAAGSPLDDISPLADCKELYFLELQFCPVTDLSPLLECKELRHLCVCACPTQDSVRPVLSQMTWLERCYMYGRTCFYASDRDYVCSDDFLPNTEKWLLGGMHFYHNWRTHPVYFEMRDALGGAYYMAGKMEGM